ncbi:MAG: arsenic resistance N-acetyltransferase ArsN2 [bacterium]
MHIRKAQEKDLNPIRELLKSLKLPVDGVEDHFDHFSVLIEDDSIVGTVGLEVYGPKALLRSLGVCKDHQSKGHGRQLYEQAMKEAYLKRINEVFLLTETGEGFFSKAGFERIAREDVDECVKVSAEFQYCCPTSAVCMRKRIV